MAMVSRRLLLGGVVGATFLGYWSLSLAALGTEAPVPVPLKPQPPKIAEKPLRIVERTAPTIAFMILSPDGKKLAYGAMEPQSGKRNIEITTRLYDIENKKDLGPLKPGTHDDAGDVVFSPDGKTFAVYRGGNDGISLWRWNDRKKFAECEKAEWTGTPTFSPDGKIVAATTSKRLCFWSAETGKRLRVFDSRSMTGFSFAAGGRLLVAEHSSYSDISKKGDPITIRWWAAARLWDGTTGVPLGQVGEETRGCGREVPRVDKLEEVGADVPDYRVSRSPAGAVLILPRLRRNPVVAFLNRQTAISLRDEFTGRELVRAVDGGATFKRAHLSSGGRTLVAFSCYTKGRRTYPTLSIWDVSKFTTDNRVAPLLPQELERLWTELGDTDARTARRAMCILVLLPETAITLIRKHVGPVPRPKPGRITELIVQLDSRKFPIREAAERQLQQLGEQALPSLRAACKEHPSLEAQRRLRRAIKQLESPGPETLRRIRAAALLRQFKNNKSARQALELLAQGAPGTWLTQEARAAFAVTPCAVGS